MLTLAATKREKGGKGANALRKEGVIPAVVYGAHQEALSIAVDAKFFDKVFAEAGEATIVSLTGLGKELPTLVHQVDLHPLTSRPQHIDFYAVTKGQKVEVAVPIVFFNEAPAVKAGANLIKVLHELEIEADPMSLPHDIQVDLSVLAAVGDQIHARDLKLPAGVTLITNPDDVLVLVQEVVEEKEEAPVADLASIEVEKKGKEEVAEEPKAE